MEWDMQIEETAEYENYQQQLELQEWAFVRARHLYDIYNAILANAWPGDDCEAWAKLEEHCADFSIDIDHFVDA